MDPAFLENLNDITESEKHSFSESLPESSATPRIEIKRSSSENNLKRFTALNILSETVSENEENTTSHEGLEKTETLTERTEQLFDHDDFFIPDDNKRMTPLSRFREAVDKVIDKEFSDGEPPNIITTDGSTTVVTILPTHSTKSIYLSHLFKYAVKQTIIQRRKEKSTGDYWDGFFYNVYGAERPQLDNLKDNDAAQIKLNLKHEVEKRLSVNTLDQNVREKLTPYRSTSSGPSERGKKAIENINRLSANITKRRQELSQMAATHTNVQHATLPTLPPKRERQLERGRFRNDKVRHSPDGRSPLSRLFYLPLVQSKPPSFSTT